MTSGLAWLDHDTTARDRTKRILALFQERGTQDQLGLGGIRDSFADLLFPGTSTIQTRLRYFLFIPWTYSRLEQDEVPSRRIGAEARENELSLVVPLLSAREEGVFGRSAGGELKRVPSEVYWGGLGSWGIRRFDASRDQYHRAVDEIYRRRKQARATGSELAEREPGVITWHPELPAPPSDFPEQATLALTREEAEFIRDRIVAEHGEKLLGWLAVHHARSAVRFPWEHPLAEAMPEVHQGTLYHARMFSTVMHGAPILYNLMLAEEVGRDALVDEYRRRFQAWAENLERQEVEVWSLGQMFAIARLQRLHAISPQTEEFVHRWVTMVRSDALTIPTSTEARKLLRNREMLLKGARSLFRNRRALEERFQGGLGMGQLSYRWAEVEALLNDLHDGLNRS
jgi:hypothetical protein